MSIYEEMGYVNREEYLYSLAEEYDVGVSEVFALAKMLGEVEDFDGLISALEDMYHELKQEMLDD